MIINLQQPIFSFIQSSEERTNTNVQQIRDKLITQQLAQENLNNGMQEFLNKYKHNSSSKGNVSEQELYSILQAIFPCDEIIDCSTETATCDYRVNRLNNTRPTILFENKDYSRSVTTEEIKKFERDLNQQKQHGIFISQKSNITFKEPFQIDIINNIIHIYIPNAEYNIDKIKIAVEIIDSLSSKISNLNQSQIETININKDDLDELIELFNDFNLQKLAIIETIKTNNKQLLDKIENMQLNSVKKILNKNGFFHSDEDFRCKHCNTFIGKNKASLGAHIRNCKANPINK
jgi:ACT domain-containing protein